MAFKVACAPLLKVFPGHPRPRPAVRPVAKKRTEHTAYCIAKTRNRDGEEHVKERNYDARKDWRVPLSGVILA
jgi:hypothetical protein